MSEPSVSFSDGDDATTTAEPAVRRRGRPRSPETIVRDQQVLDALNEGPHTKEQLVERLDLKPELVYLSLWRLRRDGRVERVADGNVRHVWRLT